MIFSNKETAKEVRTEAERQLIDWLFKQNMDLLGAMGIILKTDAHAIDEESIRNNAIANIERELPALIRTMLYKSGIIHANSAYEGDKPHYPVNLYYDNDMEGGIGGVSEAIASSPGALFGGMVEGRIHT